jgi:hypothetical protein
MGVVKAKKKKKVCLGARLGGALKSGVGGALLRVGERGRQGPGCFGGWGGSLLGRGVGECGWERLLVRRRSLLKHKTSVGIRYFEKIRVFKEGVFAVHTLACNNKLQNPRACCSSPSLLLF